MNRRVLKFTDTKTKKIAYFSIVRPTLEFVTQEWEPYQKVQINHIEKVQNKALRFIYNIKGRVSFTKLRQDVEIHSLRQRKKMGRLKLFTKCLAEGIEPPFSYDLPKKPNTK